MTGAHLEGRSLALIAELRSILRTGASDAETSRWWTLVQQIEGSLESDRRYSESERQLIKHIKAGVSAVIAAHRDGLTPQFSSVLPYLAALENTIMGRTNGLGCKSRSNIPSLKRPIGSAAPE